MAVGLVALVGVAIAVPRGEDEVPAIQTIDLPHRVGAWVGVNGVPEKILPSDPRGLAVIRRTYTEGSHTLWVAVTTYSSHNHPLKRPSIDLIVSERGAVSVSHTRLTVDLNGSTVQAISVNLLSVRRPERQFAVVYWYLLGGTAVTGEYELRARLFLNTLLGRREKLMLARVATVGTPPPELVLKEFHSYLSRSL